MNHCGEGPADEAVCGLDLYEWHCCKRKYEDGVIGIITKGYKDLQRKGSTYSVQALRGKRVYCCAAKGGEARKGGAVVCENLS